MSYPICDAQEHTEAKDVVGVPKSQLVINLQNVWLADQNAPYYRKQIRNWFKVDTHTSI